MSYLSVALLRISKQNQRSQREIADSANLPRATVNRYFTGEYKDISDVDFAELISAVSGKARDRADMVAARCEDVRNGPSAELVDISVRSKPIESKVASEFGEVRLSHEHERVLAYLRSQIPVNPAVGNLLKNMAAALGLK